MNKKGFTIVELIAVIAVMALLMILVTPTISQLAKNSNEMIANSKVKAIVTAAESFGNDLINEYQLCNSESSSSYLNNRCTISIKELIIEGYLEGENDSYVMINPVTKKEYDGYVLLCYDDIHIEVIGKYVEKNATLSCN